MIDALPKKTTEFSRHLTQTCLEVSLLCGKERLIFTKTPDYSKPSVMMATMQCPITQSFAHPAVAVRHVKGEKVVLKEATFVFLFPSSIGTSL